MSSDASHRIPFRRCQQTVISVTAVEGANVSVGVERARMGVLARAEVVRMLGAVTRAPGERPGTRARPHEDNAVPRFTWCEERGTAVG